MRLITFKVMSERLKNYIGWIQFVMIGWIFITQTEFDLVTTILLVAIALGAVSLVDFKWVFPAEQNRIAEKNPFLISMRNDIKEIKQRIEKVVE